MKKKQKTKQKKNKKQTNKKKKKKQQRFSYLPNQKLQGRGTANKHFFKDGQSTLFRIAYCLSRFEPSMYI